ncbi:ABC transporter substrate-binding protein [Pseudooceanicola sp. 216_PA32_1]|uniref:ABC transporter substrate-binding protein n=1 Tax=Pseudooceanicola pacificus TaxID=2676438 RepID=A0A844W636_9RHOB|nr:ABC transporter substrate-binding protein [Pseudooceanicola pacificus]MWB78194.1 ABC transporter substrate-binding protein [Pseudooceanicola pacificus]
MKPLKTLKFASVAILLAGATMSQAETYKVGVINALTGTYAFGGVPIQNAMKLAIQHANESGELGDVTLEVVEGDSASDKGQTITLVSRLAQNDDLLIILGPTTSLEGTAGAPVANEQKVALFGIGSSRGIVEAGPWSFKVQQVGDDMLGELSAYVAGKTDIKKVAVIFDRSNDGFVSQKNAFIKGLDGTDVDVVSEDGILSSDTDFLAIATRLASSDIDAFFVAAPAEVGGNVVVQLRQAGLPMNVPLVGPSSFATPAFIDTAGGAAEGSIVIADYFLKAETEGNADFVTAYQEAYGELPDNWAAMGYALADLAVEAIKRAGPEPTRAKVREALAGLRDVPTILGNGTWTMDDDDFDPHYGAAILVVKDGDLMLAPE